MTGSNPSRNSRTARLELRTCTATRLLCRARIRRSRSPLRAASSTDAPRDTPFVAQPTPGRLLAPAGEFERNRALAQPANKCPPSTDPPGRVEEHHGVCALESQLECGVVTVHDPVIAREQAALRLAPLVLGRRKPPGLPEVNIEMDEGKTRPGRELPRQRALTGSSHSCDDDAAAHCDRSFVLVHIHHPAGRRRRTSVQPARAPGHYEVERSSDRAGSGSSPSVGCPQLRGQRQKRRFAEMGGSPRCANAGCRLRRRVKQTCPQQRDRRREGVRRKGLGIQVSVRAKALT